MQALLERNVSDGRTVASIVYAPRAGTSEPLEFVDVGARNGSFILPPSYAAQCRLTGFEPNPEEFEKLKSNRTDAVLRGAKEPLFKEKRYFPSAIWSGKCDRTLYITVGPGAATLTGPVNRTMVDNMFLAVDSGENYYDRHQRVLSTESIPCVALDELWPNSSTVIDILKLDTEGGELEALKGAKNLLAQKRVLLLKAEFLLAPYYEPRVTLGHQLVFLDDMGYRMIGLDTDQSRYSWRPTRIRPENDHWLTYAGDAIYVVDPDRHSLGEDLTYRLGLACMAMGYNAFGLNLVRSSGKISNMDISAIEDEANRVPLSRRLLAAWMEAPNVGYRILHAIGRR